MFAVLLLLALAAGPDAEISVARTIRIAACGPTESDRADLDQLLRGTLHDHLGGGFHDSPGGPKSLERNAWYLNALAASYELKPDLFVRSSALDTVAFVLRDLKNGAGAFFRSLGGAEPPGYYAFSQREIQDALGPNRAAEFFTAYTLAPPGLLVLAGSPFAGLGDTRQTLLVRRLRRVRLPLDETIDPESNGVWVAALARAAIALKRRDFMEAAQRASEIVSQSSQPTGPGAAFGLAMLERLDEARSQPKAAERSLDAAIAKSVGLGASSLTTLAWSLAEAIRSHPSDVRRRQLARVMGDLETRFPTSEATAAAKCHAPTASAGAP